MNGNTRKNKTWLPANPTQARQELLFNTKLSRKKLLINIQETAKTISGL